MALPDQRPDAPPCFELKLRVTTRRSRTERLYSADPAHIHDAGFGDLAKRAGPEVVRILRAHRIRNGLIVEAGCGSGILAAHLADAGYEVFGFDQSAVMIRLARARRLHASVWRPSHVRSFQCAARRSPSARSSRTCRAGWAASSSASTPRSNQAGCSSSISSNPASDGSIRPGSSRATAGPSSH